MKQPAKVTMPLYEGLAHDSNSTTTARAYTVYGHSGNGSPTILVGFNGQALDPLLQGYFLGNGVRLYCCSLMRFTTPDSLSPFDEGGWNSYGYCSGDPINRVDPSGHSYIKVIAYRRNPNPRVGPRRLPRHMAVMSVDDPNLRATTSLVESRAISTNRVQSKATVRPAEKTWGGDSDQKNWDTFSTTLGIKGMTPEKRAKVVHEFVRHQLVKETGREGAEVKQKMALSMLWQLGHGADVTTGWGKSVAADILARNNEAVRAFVSKLSQR
ncbi:RHS repeat-associated core domain-containing protein [Pseudomonas sp. p21]|uniref:RHS repeat-associated core domain-containing protein n=1 Tax=Pseudomonas sp. p21 TaxID=1825979 RepID=UPI0009ED0E40|nr:RHS repeat-associated core domain-containing protein [Pseudomonas sp. p21]